MGEGLDGNAGSGRSMSSGPETTILSSCVAIMCSDHIKSWPDAGPHFLFGKKSCL